MKYIIQSKTGEFSATVSYGPEGTLLGFMADRELPIEKLNAMFTSIDYKEEALKHRFAKFPRLLTPVPEDTSFDVFWKAYGLKRNKKRSERLWRNLPEEERVKCLAYIPKYHVEIRQSGIGQKYPDTFLYNESWNDN